jgi:hypothetical protein
MAVLDLEVPELMSDVSTRSIPPDDGQHRATREIRHEYTRNLPSILAGLNASLLVSTYQAGKVVGVGVADGVLALSYHNFERAMGLAVRKEVIAVGARAQIWFLHVAPDLAPRVEPAGRHDACYVTRSSRFTGEIQGHEMAWSGEDLWIVNTAFSCVCTLHPGIKPFNRGSGAASERAASPESLIPLCLGASVIQAAGLKVLSAYLYLNIRLLLQNLIS